jgi:hypothetical protein
MLHDLSVRKFERLRLLESHGHADDLGDVPFDEVLNS